MYRARAKDDSTFATIRSIASTSTWYFPTVGPLPDVEARISSSPVARSIILKPTRNLPRRISGVLNPAIRPLGRSLIRRAIKVDFPDPGLPVIRIAGTVKAYDSH